MTRQAEASAGVSSIVAAVLLLALFTTAFTLWTVAALPQWVADREAAHAVGVQEAFAGAQAGLEALSASGDAGPTSVAVPLGPSKVPVLQQQAALGELSAEGGRRAQATFTNERILAQDGVARVTPDDEIAEGNGDRLTGVVKLNALVVFLTTSGVGNDEAAWLTVVADDGDSTVTAVLTHAGKLGGAGPNTAGCLNSELRLEVTVDVAPQAPSTTTQALLCELANDLTGYSLDLANELSPFAAGIQRLATPFSITLSDDGDGATAEGYFGASYLDSDGVESGAGAGEPADVAIDESGTSLAFTPGYQEYDGPGAAWEFGGVLHDQGDGASVDRVAGFRLTVEDGLGRLDWTLVSLSGSGARAGDGSATVQVRHTATRDLLLSADGAAFTLSTDHAGAWRAYFEDRVLLADAQAEVAVGGTGSTATLTLGGGIPWVVHLRLVTAELTVG